MTELQEKNKELDDKKLIVVMENDIPVPGRKPNTFYFRVTDKQTVASTDNIKISPNMGLKLL